MLGLLFAQRFIQMIKSKQGRLFSPNYLASLFGWLDLFWLRGKGSYSLTYFQVLMRHRLTPDFTRNVLSGSEPWMEGNFKDKPRDFFKHLFFYCSASCHDRLQMFRIIWRVVTPLCFWLLNSTRIWTTQICVYLFCSFFRTWMHDLISLIIKSI